MIKHSELSNKESCLNRATAGEMIFVLLARDEAAPATIRFWIRERIRSGKNSLDDVQMQEAENCARVMEEQKKMQM